MTIGVRKAGEAVVAHAWVDVAGVPLDDSIEIVSVPMRTPRAASNWCMIPRPTRVPIYSIPGYVAMITDRLRVEAYARALQRPSAPHLRPRDRDRRGGVRGHRATDWSPSSRGTRADDAVAVARLLAKDNRVPDIEFIQASPRTSSSRNVPTSSCRICAACCRR